MSKSKIRKPSKSNRPSPAPVVPQVVPLDDSTESMVDEWRRLQGIIADINQKLQENQKQMAELGEANKNLENQGLQIMGAASSLTRLLAGKGVDPTTYSAPVDAPEEEISSEEDGPQEVRGPYPVDAEEVNPNPRSAVLRRRFGK